MALTQQKRREEIEAMRQKEEQEHIEEAERKKKQERVSISQTLTSFSWKPQSRDFSAQEFPTA